MRAARGTLLALPLLAAGCQTQWYSVGTTRDVVRTDVVIRTRPPGAEIRFDDKLMSAKSPIRIPVEYDHAETLYERQTNYGADLREDKGTLAQVLLAPLWIPMSLFHHRQELRRHEYGGHLHTVAASLEGYAPTSAAITLDGESERTVQFDLVRAK
jgi:hypothetical protein